VRCRTPLIPGVPWPTIFVGESQIVTRDGTTLAKLGYDDGEGYIAASVELGPATPLDPIPSGFWMAPHPASMGLVWQLQNHFGRLSYAANKRRGRFPWQAQPATDLPNYVRGDVVAPVEPDDEAHADAIPIPHHPSTKAVDQ
jgi:hypothetical protein